MKIKAYPTKVTGLPANPKYDDLPCGCRVLEGQVLVVRNEALNIVIAQCLECKLIVDISPASAIEKVQ
jgi:hypothetical protein